MSLSQSDNESKDSFAGKYRDNKIKAQNKNELISKLKDNLKENQTQIKEMKDLMFEDEQIKIQLKSKIDDLTSKLKEIKTGFDDDLTDEEMDLLLGRNHSAVDIFNKEEIIDSNPLRNNLNEYSLKQFSNMNFVFGGNAMLNDFQSRLAMMRNRTFCGRINAFLEKIIFFLTPFKSHMVSLRRRYDRNVVGLFDIMRFLFILQLIVSLFQVPLLVNHLILLMSDSFPYKYTLTSSVEVKSEKEIEENQSFSICSLYIPCHLYYSRFTSNEKLFFSITLILTILVIFIIILKKWTDSKRVDVLSNLFLNNNKQFTKSFLTLWDWNVKNEKMEEDMKEKVITYLTIGVYEYKIDDIIKNRTSKEKNVLLIRRVLFISLSIIILIFAFGIIFGLYILQAYLNFVLNTSSTVSSIMKIILLIIPAIGLSIVSSIFPIILDYIVSSEKWDYNSTVVSQQFWRSYILKIISQIVVYFIMIYFGVLNKSSSQLFDSNTFEFHMKPSCPSTEYKKSNISFPSTLLIYTEYSNCVEDHISANLLVIIFTQFLLSKIVPVLMFFIRKVICVKIRKRKSFKVVYHLPSKSTDRLNMALQLHILFIFFPYISFISPMILYIEFIFEEFSLNVLHEKPEKMTLKEKTGLFILSLFNVTMIGVIMLFSYIMNISQEEEYYLNCLNGNGKDFFYNSTYLCGPFSKGESMISIVRLYIESSTVLVSIYEILSSSVVILLLVLFLVSSVFYKHYDSLAMKYYINQKLIENDYVEYSNNNLISKLRAQLRFFRRSKEKQS